MSQKNILIIEDDAAILTLTKFCLEMTDTWQVTAMSLGEEGLINAKNTNPDVILLDLILPDMGGLEIIHSLKASQATQQIPIILFTAKLIDTTALEFEGGNVVGVINKPFDCITLSARILNLTNRQQQLITTG